MHWNVAVSGLLIKFKAKITEYYGPLFYEKEESNSILNSIMYEIYALFIYLVGFNRSNSLDSI